MPKLEFNNLYLEIPNTDRNIQTEMICLLNGISGEAKSGEISAIMGSSGCGKTTLFNTLIGRVQKGYITSGTILYNGEERDPRTWNKTITYLEQDDVYYEYLTVEESVLYDAEFKNETDDQKNRQIAVDSMDKANIKHKAKTLMKSLSGGERKRAMLASVLATRPDILLLDEPTTGLDSHLAFEIVHMLEKYASENDKIVIMTIHQPGPGLFDIFGSLLFMNKGITFYNGRVKDIPGFFNEHGISMVRSLSIPEMLFELQADTSPYPEIYQFRPIVREILEKNKQAQIKNFAADNLKKSNDYTAAYGLNLKHVYLIAKRHLSQMRREKSASFYLLSKIVFALFLAYLVALLVCIKSRTPGPEPFKSVSELFSSPFSSVELNRETALRITALYVVLNFVCPIVISLSCRGFNANLSIIQNEVLNFKFTSTSLFLAILFYITLEHLFFSSFYLLGLMSTVLRQYISFKLVSCYLASILVLSVMSTFSRCVIFSHYLSAKLKFVLYILNVRILNPYTIQELLESFTVLRHFKFLIGYLIMLNPLAFLLLAFEYMLLDYLNGEEATKLRPFVDSALDGINFLGTFKLSIGRCFCMLFVSILIQLLLAYIGLRHHVMPCIRLALQKRWK